MSDKKILFITPYFAPQSHAAMFRLHKLAKLLPNRGWEVHVVTVDTNYIYNEDENLIKDLPSQVIIHRAKYVEPTMRGLRMWFGGADRTFKTLKKNQSLATLPSPQSSAQYSATNTSLGTKSYAWLRDHFLFSPDPYWTWTNPAYKMAKRVIEQENIPLILTSSLPYSTLQIGQKLKATTKVKWVADLRDPMTYDSRCHSSIDAVFIKQRKIERAALNNADAITTLTSSHPPILADTYGLSFQSKIHYIPTGVDRALLLSAHKDIAPRNQPPSLIFVGEFLPQYGSEFFKILSLARQQPGCEKLNLRVVGRREINEPRIAPWLKDLKLDGSVEFIDHVPQNQLYAMINQSTAAVLCTSRMYPWWTSFAKLVDYLALKKTVVALVPDPSEARKWLTASGLGVFLDGSLEECALTLSRFLQNPNLPTANETVCRQFLADHQVEAFERVFTPLLRDN